MKRTESKSKKVGRHRKAMDELNHELLTLIVHRFQLSRKIGQLKGPKKGRRDENRETEMLQKLKEAWLPLSELTSAEEWTALEKIFRQIFTLSFELQQQMKND